MSIKSQIPTYNLFMFIRWVRRYINERKYVYKCKGNKLMRINIINKDGGWILMKFAKEMQDELIKLGYDVTISEWPNQSADINHSFVPHSTEFSSTPSTYMITHVDSERKINRIRHMAERGAIGICMSRETRDKLISYGISPTKVCYINPAQDGLIFPQKVSLGFTYRVHMDFRKRDSMIVDIAKEIDPRIFKFVIMGADWEEIIRELRGMGFEVDYYSEFDKIKYNEIMHQIDYFCYFGFDEGNMGYLDAVAAGIGTIVTPQGYHLDTECPITYPVETISDIVNVLLNIQEERMKHYKFIKEWTWDNYAKKHVEIWKYILKSEPLENILSKRGWYNDGIFSLMLDDIDMHSYLSDQIIKKLKQEK